MKKFYIPGALKEKNFKKYYDNSVLSEIKKGSLSLVY